MTYTLAPWITVGTLNINYSFLLDNLAIIVMMAVCIITIIVLIYAQDYMLYDPNRNVFYVILSIFGVFMSVLVLSNNYVIMFIGWEYVGVISYLLISFWYTRIQAMKSALSAVLLNRMGDTFFMIAIASLIAYLNSVDYSVVNLVVNHLAENILFIIAICFLIAAMAKSAQLGLHSWLLSAMEGPTPVSALLHAATMVCAGIYVLVRSSKLLDASGTILIYIAILGALTTVVSGLMALFTNDIKRIIALSTMGQLSMMMLAIGCSNYDMAIYHLFCHAFFKALLFMAAGSIIHSIMSESQDLRTYGGLINYLPFSYTAMFIASLSLMAIPGLTGYYSKDIIIEGTWSKYGTLSSVLYLAALFSATCTSVYSLRTLYLTFMNNPRINKYSFTNIHESWGMIIPMLALIYFSIFKGSQRDLIITELEMGSPSDNIWIEMEMALPTYIKLAPLIMCIVSVIPMLYVFEYKSYIYNNVIMTYFNQRLNFDIILNNIIIGGQKLGQVFSLNIDNGILKLLGPTGIYCTISSTMRSITEKSTAVVVVLTSILLPHEWIVGELENIMI